MHGSELETPENDDLRRQIEQRTEELQACRARLRALEEWLGENGRQPEEPDRTLEERIRQEVDRTREKDQLLGLRSRHAAMGEMIGNIAHQWRQPLTAISLLIQDLRECYEYGELSLEYLEKNVGDALGMIQQMSRSLNDYRDFFSTGNESRVFSVRELLERSVSIIESSLRYHNIELTIDADGGLTATGHPNEFSQAILNIIANAREAFKERRTAEPAIRIRAFREGNRTVVTVTDNGGGIPEAVMDRIFDPYFTTRAPEKWLGLGLYTARLIIEKKMGGSLTAGNVEGGARFRIEI